MDDKFLKPYDSKETEGTIYKLWEDSGFFNPDVCVEKGITDSEAESFSIVLPPPNVTGTLHVGHAAMLAIEDILVRFNRMRGKRTLWLPGTDHAAIATQEKVEKNIYKEEEKTRHDLGREVFLKRVEDYAQESRDTIVGQIKRMGSSIDWSREAYTLDKARNLAVRTAFKKMYDDDLIYRGHRIVNWDPKLQTTVSDEEVEHVEEKTTFYYLQYGPFVISTARPETKFGDKYVVMHPDDKRYEEYKEGQEIELEWINGPIKATILKDKAIDMEFGTGVMTITPWHDVVDFEIAERHNLDKEQIIDYKGKLLPIAGEFAGQHIKKARALIVEKLKSKGLVVKTDENYIHNIATDSRGGGVIEPQIMMQWFIDVNKEFKLPYSEINGIASGEMVTLKKLMIHVVENGQVEIIPDHFSKIYFHWINNLRDWCISRQIWYGHRIPVWYRGDETYTGVEAPEGDGWKQDEDTLDTWFSSGLWTFSTLGWPEKTDDLKRYHPTDVLETGYDILFFWVARMILMSTYLTGQIPFKKVYLHGLVRDGQGRKMSKSLGNIIDPVDMSDKFGTDAVRLSLIVGTAPGNDSKLSEDKIRGYKNFANKLWNITRFVLENTEEINTENIELGAWQQEQIKEFEKTLEEITGDIENYRFYLAGEKLYHYAWHIFADKIIEESKVRLNGSDEKDKSATAIMLQEILHKLLKALHPFMPFATESIWQHLPKSKMKGREILMVEKWPI